MQRISKKQSGMTMSGTVIVLASVLLLGIVGFKTIPAYAEFNTIKDIVTKINDGNDKTKSGIRTAFDKRAQIDAITAIDGSDLVMSNGVISASYEKVIPLFGNMSILLEFDTSE